MSLTYFPVRRSFSSSTVELPLCGFGVCVVENFVSSNDWTGAATLLQSVTFLCVGKTPYSAKKSRWCVPPTSCLLQLTRGKHILPPGRICRPLSLVRHLPSVFILQDLCRIKWEPDPTSIPDNWFRGHIPDMIKCKMFELWQKDPEMYSARVSNPPFLHTQKK